MSRPTLLTRRAKIAGIGTAGLLSLLALQAAPGRQTGSRQPTRHDSRLPDSLLLQVSYGGFGGEGVDLIWRGTLTVPLAGQATVRMAYAGDPEDRGMPIWPVTALLFFSADDYRSSFIAELSGTMDWKQGEMLVTGIVTDGPAADTRVEQVLDLQDARWNGKLRLHFLPDPRQSVATAAERD